MDTKEYEKLENWVQRIGNRLGFASSLGCVIQECWRDDNIKKSDIDGLISILNTYLRLTAKKLNHLELYLMRKK